MITTQELLRATGGACVSGPAKGVLGGVTTDTRNAGPGEVFVALRGNNFDGHDFMDVAVAAGVGAVICERARSLQRDGVAFIEVDDTLHALGDIASFHRSRFELPLVAITGSNGKTTTKEMLRAIFVAAWGEKEVLANQGNFNNLVGLPLTLLQLDSCHRAAILEMGMNAPGEIARLCEIAAPTVGLITCVGAAHLAGLGTIEGVARAKGELFAGLAPEATAVVNLDDAHVRERASVAHSHRLSFGSGGRVHAENLRVDRLDACSFDLCFDGETVHVELPLGGRHNVANAVGAAACALAVGLDLPTVAAGLAKVAPPPMRLSVETLGNGVRLINDAYNANPSSLQAAFDTLAQAEEGRRILVLGEMLELGENAAKWHREAGAAAAALAPALICAIGAHARDLRRGALEAGVEASHVHVSKTHAEAAEAVAEIWSPGDAVLVKGSRGSAMEHVVEALHDKVRRG